MRAIAQLRMADVTGNDQSGPQRFVFWQLGQ
jgi:hypothetical protein